MNWNAISFDWNQARSLLAVAEEGSLSAAATALRVTQPTITRQLAALEADLGVALFDRTGRSVTLTPAGLDLLDHVRMMAEGANLLSMAAAGNAQSIDGLVRITASEMTAAYLLPPILHRICAQAPDLRIEIVAENGLSDLLLREADIAIRHLRPEQPSLMARRVSDDPMRFYATESYIETYGVPRLDPDASAHQFVSFADQERITGYLNQLGFGLGRRNFRYASNSQLVELQIARLGHAIAIVPDRIAAGFPDLRPVFTRVAPFPVPVWLVAHRELQTSRRVRLVFDVLAGHLGQSGFARPAQD